MYSPIGIEHVIVLIVSRIDLAYQIIISKIILAIPHFSQVLARSS